MNTILLAAGLSTRMQGRQKLLLPWGEETVVEHCVRQALLGLDGIGMVLVVTGCDSDDVLKALNPIKEKQLQGLFGTTGLEFVYNADYQSGQFSSTLAGVRRIPADQPFFITLGDLPLITAQHYQGLEPLLHGYDAVRPSCDGIPGHPVLHAAKLHGDILQEQRRAAPEHPTMRGLLATKKTNAPDDADIAWISDIDTPEAYRTLYQLTFGRLPS